MHRPSDRGFFIANGIVSAAALSFLAWLLLIHPHSASAAGTLAEGHPEVYAKVEVNVRSRGAPATLLSLGASSGTDFRLFVDRSGRLAFDNRAADPPVTRGSGVSIGSGWHTVELHIWVRGSTGTCEVFYDGHPLADLSWPQRCPTGAALIHSYLVGDAGGGQHGAAQFKDPALATSAF